MLDKSAASTSSEPGYAANARSAIDEVAGPMTAGMPSRRPPQPSGPRLASGPRPCTRCTTLPRSSCVKIDVGPRATPIVVVASCRRVGACAGYRGWRGPFMPMRTEVPNVASGDLEVACRSRVAKYERPDRIHRHLLDGQLYGDFGWLPVEVTSPTADDGLPRGESRSEPAIDHRARLD